MHSLHQVNQARSAPSAIPFLETGGSLFTRIRIAYIAFKRSHRCTFSSSQDISRTRVDIA
jgi:hypothetical protein